MGGQSRVSEAGADSLKRLVVTADDFGLSLPVNDAVEQAHTHGILTATSLMTGAPACDDAVERARRLPRLGVGLHLTLVDGRPVLPCDQIPGLVGPDGRFSTDPVKFGTALFFSSELRRQAEAEVTAQFDKFRRTGLVMDHVNGHQHFHMHPSSRGSSPSSHRPSVIRPCAFRSNHFCLPTLPRRIDFSAGFHRGCSS